jgi:hypothetical protein
MAQTRVMPSSIGYVGGASSVQFKATSIVGALDSAMSIATEHAGVIGVRVAGIGTGPLDIPDAALAT